MITTPPPTPLPTHTYTNTVKPALFFIKLYVLQHYKTKWSKARSSVTFTRCFKSKILVQLHSFVWFGILHSRLPLWRHSGWGVLWWYCIVLHSSVGLPYSNLPSPSSRHYNTVLPLNTLCHVDSLSGQWWLMYSPAECEWWSLPPCLCWSV